MACKVSWRVTCRTIKWQCRRMFRLTNWALYVAISKRHISLKMCKFLACRCHRRCTSTQTCLVTSRPTNLLALKPSHRLLKMSICATLKMRWALQITTVFSFDGRYALDAIPLRGIVIKYCFQLYARRIQQLIDTPCIVTTANTRRLLFLLSIRC